MKLVALLIVAYLSIPSPSALAGGLSDNDSGTYIALGRDFKPIDFYYRLSRKDGSWMMEGKRPNTSSWENISCEKGCEYRDTAASEIEVYFPADWKAKYDIACIHNMAQAFCRCSEKGDGAKFFYVVLAFVTGKPTPIFVRRVSGQAF